MDTTVFERIGWARRAAGLSARALSDLAGLASSHVSLIERWEETGNGDRIAASTLVRLADTLGVSLDWLIGGRGARPSEDTIRRAVHRAQRASVARTGTNG